MSGKELFIRFTARAFRKLLSIYVFSYFPFGFEGRIWDRIVSVPDHCLSSYFFMETLLITDMEVCIWIVISKTQRVNSSRIYFKLGCGSLSNHFLPARITFLWHFV